MLTTTSSVADVQRHLVGLYAKRNRIVDPSFDRRVAHVCRRFGRLADSHRKKEKMPLRLAKATVFFINTVNYFDHEVSLQRGMMHKFPPYGCSYCTQKPCGCTPEKRPEPTLRIHAEQELWSMTQFQQHLFDVYGQNHKSFTDIFCRLESEFTEFSDLMAGGAEVPNDINLIYESLELEAADVMSWLLAMANFEKYNLLELLIQFYQVCPVCSQNPCKCPPVFVSQDGNFMSTTGMRNSVPRTAQSTGHS